VCGHDRKPDELRVRICEPGGGTSETLA
jgi:hypothetical protein